MKSIYTKNAMNLRNVTIWTTGVILSITIAVPCLINASQRWQGDVSKVLYTLWEVGFLWLLSGSPLLVSFIIAIKSRRNIASAVLLVSTITFAIWYGYMLHFALWSGEYLSILAILYIGIFSLPVMLPAWIATLVLNWRYAKKQEPEV